MSENIEVYKAIARVTAGLAKEGISKARKNQQQGYVFRSIDDIYNALAVQLAEAQLCIIPRIVSRSMTERQTKGGMPLFYVVVETEFDFVSAIDGSRHTAKIFGEAMDSADKATNKAMSAAYKYMALQTFAIPTEGDNDADAHTPDVAARATSDVQPYPADRFAENLPVWRQAIAEGKRTAEQIIAMVSSKGTLTDEQKAAIRKPVSENAKNGANKAIDDATSAESIREVAKMFSERAPAVAPVESNPDAVRRAIESAKTKDDLHAAADLIRSLGDQKCQAELTALYRQRLLEKM